MRDYLEELLALLEEEEEERPSPLTAGWAADQTPASLHRGGKAPEETDGPSAGKKTPEEGEELTVPSLKEADTVTQELVRDPGQILEEQLEEMERAAAVARSIQEDAPSRRRERTAEGASPLGETGRQEEIPDAVYETRLETGGTQSQNARAQALSGSLRQLERAGQYRGTQQNSQSVPLAQETARQKDGVSGTAQIQARQVDRIFQRDARRYDNRFTLF